VALSAILGVLLAADPAAMLRKADAPHEAFREGVIRLRVQVVESGKPPVDTVMDLFVKGTEQSLCVFREGKQKGRRILTVGDKVWLIVPTASKPVPVSKSQRLLGAASFGDVARIRFADEYAATLRPELEPVREGGGETPCHVLDLKAQEKGAAYPTGVLWTGEADGLARRLRLFLGSGKEAKEVSFTRYDDKGRVGTMKIRDLLTAKGGNATILTFVGYEARPIDPSVFDPEGARAVP
jgi:hypothetical protein